MIFLKSIRKFSNYKKTAITGLLAVFAMFLSTHFANAFFFDSIAGSAIGFIMSVIAYALGFIAGVLFQIIGYVVTLALNVNLMVTSPANLVVKSGWDIMLNITNLGFVLAIIVISFATILRFENYAIKKTLWKLIVAALLVNFSLTISGALVDVANNATQFIMNKSGVSGDISMDTLKGSSQWATAIAGMFQVQKYLQVKQITDVADTNVTLSNIKGVMNGTIGSFVNLVASLVFIAVFVFIASITFFTVGVLLFVRYVQLSFLLMFSPIIWLAWIFPATQNYWQMWWKRFLKWTFFAPIMMFFMYLSLRAMSGMGAMTRVSSDISNPVTFGLEGVGQMAVVIGLILGGMYVANAMGIEFADKIYDASSKYGKGWAYRGGQRVMGSKPMGETQKFLNNTLGGIPGLRAIPRGLNRLGVTTEKGAVDAMSSYRGYVKGLKGDRLKNELSTQSGRKLNVGLEEAAKAGNLKPDMDVVKDTLMDPDKLEAMEKSFKAQNLNIGDVTKAIGVNSKILKAAKEGNAEVLVKEQTEFFEKMAPNDFSKNKIVGELYKKEPSFKDTLGGKDAVELMQKAFADAMVKANRVSGMYKLFPNMNAEQITGFEGNIKRTINELKATGVDKDIKKAESIEKSLAQAISKRLYGEPPEDEKEGKKDEKKEEKKEGGDKGGKK